MKTYFYTIQAHVVMFKIINELEKINSFQVKRFANAKSREKKLWKTYRHDVNLSKNQNLNGKQTSQTNEFGVSTKIYGRSDILLIIYEY